MELSLLIPARNEIFLKETIQDAIKNIEADTEIIVTLDGEWPFEPIPQYDRVKMIYVNQSIGQRAGANLACRLSTAKYVMKLDAHCSFDKGFDRKMIEFMQKVGDDVTAVPIMRNLWAFDWKCYSCGKRTYQGPTPEKCSECGSRRLKRKIVWQGKSNPQSTSFRFDTEPHFRYFDEYKKRPEYRESLEKNRYTETMSLQGSCFMATRKKYWELELCSENVGSWGNQGLEVACKTWLSGGRVLVNHNTWYAHMFRTQGGDFGFPYKLNGREVEKTKKDVWEQIKQMKCPKQTKPVSWLIEKFSPVPSWTNEEIQKLKESERLS